MNVLLKLNSIVLGYTYSNYIECYNIIKYYIEIRCKIMYLRKITKILNDQLDNQLEFKFISINENLNELQNLITFNILSDEEKCKYEKCNENEKKKFVSSSARIVLPNISTDYLVEVYKNNPCNKITYDLTIDKIKKIINCSSEEEEKIAFATYIILHEVGHWIDFKEIMKNNPYTFEKKDLKIRKNLHDEYCNFGKNIKNIFNLNDKEKIELKRLFKKYRNIPLEKNADQYADKNLERVMNKLKEIDK